MVFAASRIRSDAKDERGRNFGGKGKPTPIYTIKVPMGETRRKRRGMHLQQKNLAVIASKKRRETRQCKIKEDRRTEG